MMYAACALVYLILGVVIFTTLVKVYAIDLNETSDTQASLFVLLWPLPLAFFILLFLFDGIGALVKKFAASCKG